mmetsp:Transcript_13067/g.41909  ORF Transcript_13067/g.41909 Transcript_13067/m.41909 type:complete len:234 (-) Transcript_13067:982-1683(-)
MVSTLRQHCALPASDVTLPWRASHAHSFWRRQPLCHPARDEPLPKEHGRRRGVHVGHRACRQPEGRLDLWHALLEVPPHEDERGRARRVQQRLEGKPPRDAVEEPPRVSKPGAALPLLPARREALPRRLRRRLLEAERHHSLGAVQVVWRRRTHQRLEARAVRAPPAWQPVGEGVEALGVLRHVRLLLQTRRPHCAALAAAPERRVEPKDERWVDGRTLAPRRHLGRLRHELV